MKYSNNCNKFQISGIYNINESLSTHYLIYKIINNINGKYYIGQHKTNNPLDEYMGSGKLINQAEQKYGLSSFTKEILFDFDNFEDMNNKEIELVQLSNCFPYDQMSYNINTGGKNYEMSNAVKEQLSKKQHIYQQSLSQEERNKISIKSKELWNNRSYEEQEQIKEKCRKANLGENNPMYGHSCTEFMSEEKIKQWRENKRKALSGEKHPIYGTKMLYDLEGNRHYIKIDKIQQYLDLGWKESKLKNIHNNQNKTHVTYGRKWMHIPNTNIRKLVLHADIQKYLDLGYVMGSNIKSKKV